MHAPKNMVFTYRKEIACLNGTFLSAAPGPPTSNFGKERPRIPYTNSERWCGNVDGHGDLCLAKEKSRQKGTDEES